MTGGFVRHGLQYTPYTPYTPYFGDGLLHYQPHTEFDVDGIRYTHHCAAFRAIIEFLPDDCGGGAHMFHSQPPTESELDQWVKDDSGDVYV